MESASNAYKTCYENRSTFAKKWWTPELSLSKSILSIHFRQWKESGFPKENNDIYYMRYLLARKNFRQAVKNAQNKSLHEEYNKINKLKNTTPQKFWSKMRQLKKSSTKRPLIIKQEKEEITKEFADHFNTLLNCPRTRTNRPTKDLPTEANRINDIFTVSTEDIVAAITLLKVNKSMDPYGISAEHLIFAENEALVQWLSESYNFIFQNSITPKALSETIILPFVKSYRKSLKDPGNYRGISIIPIFTKLLEYIILIKCPNIAESHPLQYGFKENSSTLHAEFLVSETIRYYNRNNSPIYVCSLDAEKAFDSCNWDILFEKLHYEKALPLPVTKVIKALYENSKAKVIYNGCHSEYFNISQGVRQGSVLSPHLYNIYTENLLKEIHQNCNIGTSIHGQYTGITMYADDIILMSTTISGIQHLANKCSDYNLANAICFNSDKTELLISGQKNNNAYLKMDGYRITPNDRLKHLGFIWNNRNNKKNIATIDEENITERISKFWSIIKTLVKGGIRFCHPKTIVHLFNTIAIPTLIYGLELCSLSADLTKKLDIQGRNAIKSLFNISKHSKNYLNSLLQIDHISTVIIRNKLNLFTRLLRNKQTSQTILSILQENLKYPSYITDIYKVTAKLNIDFYDLLVNKKYPKIYSYYDEVPEEKANILIECLNFWNIGGQRKRFAEIMEERIPDEYTQIY